MFLFQVGLLSQVNIEEQPKLALLRKSEEDWAEFSKVTITVSLLLLLFLSLTLPNQHSLRTGSQVELGGKENLRSKLAKRGLREKKAGQPVTCRQILVS